MSRLIVLTYHRVLDANEPSAPAPSLVSTSPAVFERHVRRLARRYSVVSLGDVLEARRGRRPLPERAVLITFDDAYRDFGEVAWPILRRRGLTATLFVPTAHADHPGRLLWWDRLARAFSHARPGRSLDLPWGPQVLDGRRANDAVQRAIQRHAKALPHDAAMSFVNDIVKQVGEPPPPSRPLMLGWKELRELAREGVTLGAHTRTHVALTRVSIARARIEIRGSIEDLAHHIGIRPVVFAYPFGDHDPAVVEIAKDEGIEIAVTTDAGHNHLPLSDPLRLRRTNVNPRGARWLMPRLLPVVEPLDRWRHARRTARQRVALARAIANASAAPAGAGRAAERTGDAHSRADGISAQGGRAPEETATEAPQPGASGQQGPIAYMMSRFPKLTETFVLYELAALESMGADVEVFPLLRERVSVAHPEAEPWVRRAHYQPLLSLSILRSQLHFLHADPKRYLGLFFEVLGRTLGSANFFFGALGIFPKAVHFARLMQLRQVRHVHAHFANHPAAAAFIVHRLTGIPYSFTAHGSDLHVERRMLDAKVAQAAFVSTVSQYNRELIVSECGEAARSKVHVVHCGVDPSVFSDSDLELTPRARSLTTVCVASFEEVKGHEHLVEAYRILRDLGWRLRCHLIGEGPLRNDLEARIARAGLEDAFVFHGGLPRPLVARLVSIADVAVLASQPTRRGKREGIPVALMEAMAAGLPVVASRLSGIPELVDHKVSGLLVPPADPVGLANALAYLAENPEARARMGHAGREKVLAEFDLRTNARKLLALILDEKPAVPERRAVKSAPRRQRARRARSSERLEASP